MIFKIQRSRRHLCDVTITGSFQTGPETTICRRLQGLSQLSTPFYSLLILRIDAAMNGLWVGALKLSLPPGAGNPTYATAVVTNQPKWYSFRHSYTLYLC